MVLVAPRADAAADSGPLQSWPEPTKQRARRIAAEPKRCERGGRREREREREKGEWREGEAKAETERETDRHRERQIHKDETDKERDRQRERERDLAEVDHRNEVCPQQRVDLGRGVCGWHGERTETRQNRMTTLFLAEKRTIERIKDCFRPRRVCGRSTFTARRCVGSLTAAAMSYPMASILTALGRLPDVRAHVVDQDAKCDRPVGVARPEPGQRL